MTKFLRSLLCAFAFITASTTTFAQTLPVIDIKEVRFPGIVCSIRIAPFEPEKFVILAARRPFISQYVIEKCLTALAKKPFKKIQQTLSETHISLKWWHTPNMMCAKELPIFGPERYVLNFYDFSLTGKEQEIEACLAELETAPERVLQPQPLSWQGNT